MSFYQGGMRFAGRRSASTTDQPPNSHAEVPSVRSNAASASAATNTHTHPLRQNSVGQSAPYQRSSSFNSRRDPKSYAARAHAKPDLAVDTSPAIPKTGSGFSPATSNRANNSSTLHNSAYPRDDQDGGVPDRSPLQKLEVKLGDISKEEKRARVEEAEHNVRTKAALVNGGGTLRSKRGSVDGNRELSRKSGPGSVNSSTPNNRPNGTLSNKSRARDTTAGSQSGDKTVSRSLSKTDPYSPNSRSRGYDAALTGGAAAAAIGAFQTSRTIPDDRSSPLRNMYTPEQDGGEGSTSNKEANVAGGQQQHDSSVKDGVGFGTNQVSTNLAQTQAGSGQGGRQQVKFGQTEGEDHAKRGSLRFSQLSHPVAEGKARRYRGTVPLTEWKTARTAILEAKDLDLEQKQTASNRQSQTRAGAGAFRASGSADTSQTIFNPSLMLRCGPLLRYTGMRGDKDAVKSGGRSFWRGSVMIVTDDASSSYEAPPTLRLYAKPLSTPTNTSTQPNAVSQQGAALEQNDPLAGQTKCSPTGRTLYLKPVSYLQPETDLSRAEGSNGLFVTEMSTQQRKNLSASSDGRDGESMGQMKEVSGHRLHTERGVTFWRFNIEVELGSADARLAYRINQGPATTFWVPAKTEPMNIMFHSCNGFSLSVDSNNFSGPDPLWRDVLSSHQSRPFHVMLGGGDQIYNDAVTRDTTHFQEWLHTKDHDDKESASFTEAMQEELESFYLNRYAVWFSQGLFGMANAQIPMVNVWDDHDIIDGFGSYPHDFMSCPVFGGIGAVAYKYYMLFQHQSLPSENEQTEPSWVLGTSPGPYISQLSRSVYMSLGGGVAFVGLDCRTDRMRDEILSEGSYNAIFDRLDREVVKGETKHLIVLLGIPIAYPRMSFAENILTSRAIDPIKALARAGMFGGLLNKYDGGVEVLDDLDDHWTAKHHKEERKWLVEELQDFAAAKSVRITILGGDVHLAAVGQFRSKKKFGIPKDHDHRYMPNIISSAIVNTPPPEAMADFLNKRNKIHHFDDVTDEDMIPLFTYDVNGKDRNNHHLLPRRNWCSINLYEGLPSRAASPESMLYDDEKERSPKRTRSFSLRRSRSAESNAGRRRPNVLRKLSNRIGPPSSFRGPTDNDNQQPYANAARGTSVNDAPVGDRPLTGDHDGPDSSAMSLDRPGVPRTNSFQRRPSVLSAKDTSGRQGHINLEGGLEVTFHCEKDQKDAAGKTMPYRMLIPALSYDAPSEAMREPQKKRFSNLIGSISRRRSQKESTQGMPYEVNEPAAPAAHGDKRYTTLMEERARANGSAKLGGDGTVDAGSSPVLRPKQTPSNQPDAAYMEKLPRSSGPVETDMPEEARRASFEQRRSSFEKTRPRSHSQRSRSGSDAAPDVPTIPTYYKNQQKQQQPQTSIAKSNSTSAMPNAPPRYPIAPPPQDGNIARKRYYAQPFKKEEMPLLGPVNNRIENIPTNAFAARQANATAGVPRERRTISNPVPASTTTIDTSLTSAVQAPTAAQQQQQQQQDSTRAYHNDVSNELRSRAQPSGPKGGDNANVAAATNRSSRPAKDPYAHYYPEAVEASYESAAEDHDHEQAAGTTTLSSWSSSDSDDSPVAHDPPTTAAEARGINTSAPPAGAHSDTNAQGHKGTHYTADSISPSPSPSASPSASDSPSLSPQRSSSPLPEIAPRPRSKLERLTGETHTPSTASAQHQHQRQPSQQQQWPATRQQSQNNRPLNPPSSYDHGPGQAGVSDKAARRLGVGIGDDLGIGGGGMPAGMGTRGTATGAPAGGYGERQRGGSGKGKGGLGGLVRRLSERRRG